MVSCVAISGFRSDGDHLPMHAATKPVNLAVGAAHCGEQRFNEPQDLVRASQRTRRETARTVLRWEKMHCGETVKHPAFIGSFYELCLCS